MTQHASLSLNGDWNIIGLPPDGREPVGIAGRVPGHVHGDLLRAGLIPDPFIGEQAEECQWVETWNWVYERRFELPADFTPGWNVLEFGGLDTFATVTLNGTEIGRTDNMFVPHAFEVGPLLRRGTNTLSVRFAAPVKAIEGKPYDRYFACFNRERVYIRRMQCGFGWDWVHRFVSAGIWRPVSLATYDTGRVTDVYVRTEKLEEGLAHLRVEYGTELRTAEALTAEVVLTDPNGRTRFVERHEAVEGTRALEVALRDPELWWPHDRGEQPLYRCSVTLARPDGTVAHRREVTFGVRTVALEQMPDDIGRSFTLIVNGERIFAKGGNWVPADPFPGEVAEARYERLVALARAGNANMLRVWGGGIYEPEAFWDACDRAGILIGQDFLLACAAYPEDDPAFLEALRAEFEQAIRLLRNHPSLVLWSGDNELGMNDDSAGPYSGRRIAETVTGPLAAELDPSRPFMPTSPYGGNPNNSPTHGDCHLSAWYDPSFLLSDMRHYRAAIDACWGRFQSEYVTVGMPPLRSVLKWATEGDVKDPSARVLEYHNKDNPYNGIDEATHYQLLKRTAERLYGPSDDAAVTVRRMEYVQYEWVRLACEALRRRKYACSGLLFWMFNDCWPANGCSLVDYYGLPKAGWYGMKRGFSPLLAALEPGPEGVTVWLCNDTRDPLTCEVELRFQPWTGGPRWRRAERVEVPADGVARVAHVPAAEIGRDGVLVCDAFGGTLADRAWYFAGMPAEMELPPARLRIAQAGDGASGTVTVAANTYARVVSLDAHLDFSDNYFDLLPGEERTIRWSAPGAPFRGEVPVSWWNRD